MWLYHTDIKPSNFFAKDDQPGGFGSIRLAYFSNLAEAGLYMVRFKKKLCTIGFRAPELLVKQLEAAHGNDWLRADIWAFGITLCECFQYSIYSHMLESDAEPFLAQLMERLLRPPTSFAKGCPRAGRSCRCRNPG